MGRHGSVLFLGAPSAASDCFGWLLRAGGIAEIGHKGQLQNWMKAGHAWLPAAVRFKRFQADLLTVGGVERLPLPEVCGLPPMAQETKTCHGWGTVPARVPYGSRPLIAMKPRMLGWEECCRKRAEGCERR